MFFKILRFIFAHTGLLHLMLFRRDRYLELIYQKVIQQAWHKGLPCKNYPKLRITRSYIPENYFFPRSGTLVILAAYFDSIPEWNIQRMIIINPYRFDSYACGEFLSAILLAHELGHWIDFTHGRKCHPFLAELSSADEELFANAVAALIFSKIEVSNFMSIFGHSPSDILQIAQLKTT